MPGLAYPLWHLAAPTGQIDSLLAWVAIAACFLAVPLVHRFRPLSRTTLQGLMSCIGALVTVHLFALATLNDMQPFFAIGSTIAILATAFFLRSQALLFAYFGFVVALGIASYIWHADPRKIAYWGGTVPILMVAYHRLGVSAARQGGLERLVATRTAELSASNQLLRDEIERRSLLEEQLRRTQKMEAVGRLAGGVAHDFNNLLTTIGIYAELVQAGLSQDSPLRKELGQIQKASEQAAALTHQLLTLGSRSHAPLEPIDLSEVVDESARMLRHLLGEDTRLELLLTDEPQLIWANQEQLQQILINLCINSRDAMPGSGRVQIEVGRRRRSDLEAYDFDPPPVFDQYVMLACEDTGEGMDADSRERAFDPFFTTKLPEKGSGLGLSIAQGIVSQAGGYARLESEVGKGTRIELHWPLVDCEESDHADVPAASRSRRTKRILLAEDEADLRFAIARILEEVGYEVTSVDSAESALKALDASGRAFDLVLSDVVMREMSGIDLARQVRARGPLPRILLISGHLDERVISQMPRDLPFLAKPFSAPALMERVRELLSEEGDPASTQPASYAASSSATTSGASSPISTIT